MTRTSVHGYVDPCILFDLTLATCVRRQTTAIHGGSAGADGIHGQPHVADDSPTRITKTSEQLRAYNKGRFPPELRGKNFHYLIINSAPHKIMFFYTNDPAAPAGS